jgi:glycosyltransferase involved in cell wall biosynthesis
MGSHTEIIFIDDGSTDGTSQCIQDLIRAYPNRDLQAVTERAATGKAGAVSDGFDMAQGDVLIILDADMAVAPEDLPRFYMALAENLTDVANGTRFVYPMDADVMSPKNRVGNRVFSHVLSALLGTRLTDTLCGTKAIFRRDWPRIKDLRPLFGGHDRWGDFDLLLSAHHLGLRITDVPVPYGARLYGESKMRMVRDGTAFALTCLAGIRRARRVARGTSSLP